MPVDELLRRHLNSQPMDALTKGDGMTTGNIEELEKAERDARAALRELEDLRDAFIREETAKARDKWNSQHAEELETIRSRVVAAISNLTSAKESQAMSGDGAPYPLGTQLVEWKRPSTYGPAPMKLTGRKGVVEAITRESEHPNNRSCSRAEIGDFVIRVLKNDGTRSKQYETFVGYRSQWLPEGKKPKQSA